MPHMTTAIPKTHSAAAGIVAIIATMLACTPSTGVTMRALLLACVLLSPMPPATAQTAEAMVVRRIVVDGKPARLVDQALQITVQAPDGKEVHRLAVDQLVAPGTRVTTGPGVLLEIGRDKPALRIVLEPGTRLTLQQSNADAARAEVGSGKASFSLLGQLDFYFGVSSFRKVFAIAKGTRFSVSAEAGCAAAREDGCVTIELDEGRLELETRRPVAIGSTGIAGRDAPALDKPPSGEDDTVAVTDAMQAGEARSFALDPARFAVRFDTWVDADRYFGGELARAQAQGDPALVLLALRNALVIKRLGGRNDEAASLAAQGLALARARGDRLWEFRFLIDEAFVTWLQKRDASALPLFAQAFAMTDVTQTLIARSDLASMYGRYGGIRFEARNRAQPEQDVDAAEDFMQRALKLREPAPGEPPTLDLAWSHYGLGVLLRIARNDYAQADRHFSRAVALRREILGARDDIVIAQMQADAALAREQLVYQRARERGESFDSLSDELGQVRHAFEESLAMLGRLFPNGEQRSIGAVARRMADFEARVGDGLFDQQRSELALAEYRAAQARYAQALAVFARIPDSNTSAERRFAYLGLGKTELRLDRPLQAAEALRLGYALALQERCAAAPEAPSPAWVADLVERLAVASERSGAMAAAADYRHEIGTPPPCAAVSPVHASEPPR